MRKPRFCIYAKTKAQISFTVTDSTIHLLSKFKVSSLKQSSVAAQPDFLYKNLCFIGVEKKPCVWSFQKLGFIKLQIDN